MPIFEQIYRQWQGDREGGLPVWWVVGRTGIALLWKKSMILLMFLASLPFLFRAGQIYMVSKFDSAVDLIDGAGSFNIDAGFFYSFINGQIFFLILVMIMAGAGSIASDRKFKALPLYFSKPVDFRDYITGKMIMIGFYGAVITVVPAILLFLIKVFISRDMLFLRTFYWVPVVTIIYAFMVIITLSAIIMAVSSASRGTRSAAIMFFVIMTFPDVFRRVLGKVPAFGLISVSADLKQTGAVFFGIESPFDYSSALSAGVLLLVIAVSLFVIWRKVKPTEVVS